ncbi:flagellin [Candidatus Levibacter sp. Uisw_134_01]|uniref:flagellin N-terminal helical domain-containing protein n=1 Tax=Candidatus Levibacter sp. Uisw_134_01 TaxID=3230999 RepID=UPI003D48CCB7
MASINTNISALSAQKSMSDQISKSEQAIERLSTGLRINHAADDAAGSAIASKMESQVRSLGVAIRNGHDAISMTQTAEGALGEMENILQRVRELAVQAGNNTLSETDRSAIQQEVDALTDEINSIASSTNFNGVNLLDGSSSSVNFQVGVNASDSLSVDLESAGASDLGLSGKLGANVYTSGRVVLGTVQNVDTDAIKINGKDFLAAAVTGTTVGTLTGAAVIASTINENTATHGAVATAFNRVEGGAVGSNFNMTSTFSITSGGTAETIAIQSSLDDVITAINLEVADITASKGENNQLILSNTSGNQIIVGGDSHQVGITADTYEGMYSLENIDGSAVKIELGNLANGYVQETDATGTHMGLFGLNEVSEGKTKGLVVSTDVLALTDDIQINGVQVGATKVDTAQAKASAINAISDQSGVTAKASTIVDLELDFNIAASDGTLKINGVLVLLDGKDSVSDVVTEINDQTKGPFGVVASATSEGLLRLTNENGGDIKFSPITVAGFITAVTDGDNKSYTPAVSGAHLTIRGNITLTSEDGGVIKLTDGTTDGSGLAKLGLIGQSGMESAGTGGVNLSTMDGAVAALTSIDSAMDKLSGFRASFGAVENRIDAKINNLTTLKVNTQAAQSRIEDADFAAETTNMTKAQILSQAATSMLAQANASKQNLLALLQG